MYQIVHFKYVQYMCQLYLRKGILKNKIQWAVWDANSDCLVREGLLKRLHLS